MLLLEFRIQTHRGKSDMEWQPLTSVCICFTNPLDRIDSTVGRLYHCISIYWWNYCAYDYDGYYTGEIRWNHPLIYHLLQSLISWMSQWINHDLEMLFQCSHVPQAFVARIFPSGSLRQRCCGLTIALQWLQWILPVMVIVLRLRVLWLMWPRPCPVH